MESYKHEPLSDSKREIRIFTLLPPSLGAQLQGHLRAINFDSSSESNSPHPSPYETLSYVWGTTRSSIVCSTSTLPPSRSARTSPTSSCTSGNLMWGEIYRSTQCASTRRMMLSVGVR